MPEGNQKSLSIERCRYLTSLDNIEPSGLGLVYSRLADLTLLSALPLDDKLPGAVAVDASGARVAKSMFLRACQLEPSSRTWLGVGKAAWALEELVEAEDAFSVCLSWVKSLRRKL